MLLYSTVYPFDDYRYMSHCPKNILNPRIKTEPVTVGTDITVYSMSCFCFAYIWPMETSHTRTSIPLPLLQP